ncbi:predicted protein [Methanosarcina acetivorans C2A]|uniref:Uncharacterized protein n=1 Tax=Methanosarcina acetivorans (strain ATCC 35395 / DSM 2834 / JCM 12185 / C2A) TaxID=188937 RepID=Q8TKC8_METAC|nr:predicted protein [Methanosarcina acetivorans C2A]
MEAFILPVPLKNDLEVVKFPLSENRKASSNNPCSNGGNRTGKSSLPENSDRALLSVLQDLQVSKGLPAQSGNHGAEIPKVDKRLIKGNDLSGPINRKCAKTPENIFLLCKRVTGKPLYQLVDKSHSDDSENPVSGCYPGNKQVRITVNTHVNRKN